MDVINPLADKCNHSIGLGAFATDTGRTICDLEDQGFETSVTRDRGSTLVQALV